MNQLEYELSANDQLMVAATTELVDKLARSNLLTAAQRLSVGKLQLLLSRLPRLTGDFNLDLGVTGPRRTFGEVRTYHFWTVMVRHEMLTVCGGGHFYQPATGGDSFTSFRWVIAPGVESEYADNMNDLKIVPDLAPFHVMVNKLDFSNEKYAVEVIDSANPFLDDPVGTDAEDSSPREDDLQEILTVAALNDSERKLAETIDLEAVKRFPPDYAHGVEECDFCRRTAEQMGLFVDGAIRGGSEWANMCATCFSSNGVAVEWGKGQLYAKQGDGSWRLVGGFQPE